MLHEERISFDGGRIWFQLKYMRQLERAQHGRKLWLLWLGCILIVLTAPIALGMLFTPLEDPNTGESASWGFRLGVFLFVAAVSAIGWLSGIFMIMHYRKELAREDLNTKRLNDYELSQPYNIYNLSITDVQRKEEQTIRPSEAGGNIVAGGKVGYGLVAGAAKVSPQGCSTSYAVFGWQFITNMGVLLLPDEAYELWLNAGKPNEALYSTRTVLGSAVSSV